AEAYASLPSGKRSSAPSYTPGAARETHLESRGWKRFLASKVLQEFEAPVCSAWVGSQHLLYYFVGANYYAVVFESREFRFAFKSTFYLDFRLLVGIRGNAFKFNRHANKKKRIGACMAHIIRQWMTCNTRYGQRFYKVGYEWKIAIHSESY